MIDSDIVELLRVPYEDYLLGNTIDDVMAEAADTIEALRAENAKLREALRPFADRATAIEAQYKNCLPADNLSAGIKYRYLRAARAAMGGKKE